MAEEQNKDKHQNAKVAEVEAVSPAQPDDKGKDTKEGQEKKQAGETDKKEEKEVKIGPNCFFEIAVGSEKLGQVEFKLYDDVAPKTAANFRGLCSGKDEKGRALPKDFGYQNTHFHRVIPGFMVQGGDFERRDGTGGISIYGAKFDDEKFVKKHDKIGLLSSANAGPNTNGSQFFITTIEKCEWLDNKHVVFGEVVSGMDVVKAVEKLGNKDGKISKKAVVGNCGIAT